MTPLNEYITIQEGEGNFYAVHMGGVLYFCGLNEMGDPIWSDNLQDCKPMNHGEAEETVAQYAPYAKFDPVGVDMHVIA